LADRGVLIEALNKVSWTEDVENVLLHRYIGSCPFSQLVRQGSEGLAIGHGLALTAGLEKDCGGREQSDGDRESPVGFQG
jgi:hypothetical protein